MQVVDYAPLGMTKAYLGMIDGFTGLLAFSSSAAEDVDEKACGDHCGDEQHQRAMSFDGMKEQIYDLRAEEDGQERGDQVVGGAADEHGGHIGSDAHIEDAGSKGKQLEGEGRRHRGGDQDGEPVVAVEAGAHFFVLFRAYLAGEHQLAAGAADIEGDERADGRPHSAEDGVDPEMPAVAERVAGDDEVHGNGEGAGVDDAEHGHAPEAEGL